MNHNASHVSRFVNDAVREEISKELTEYEEHFMFFSPKETLEKAELLHRYRAINRYLGNHELPTDCAIGIYAYAYPLNKLNEFFDLWKNDSEKAIEEFLCTVGEKLFKDLQDEGESVYDVFKVVLSWKEDENEA